MQDFMITLLICSVTMSALALLYMAATPILAKRYCEKGRYYAWLIIVLGLIVPFRPQWGVVSVELPVSTGVTETLIVQTDGVQNSAPPITSPHNAADINVTAASQAMRITWAWWQIGFAVWLAGSIIFIARHGVKHYRFVKMARRWSERITDGQVLRLLQELKSEMGIKKRIPIYLCECAGSPMMIGFFKPRILLPTADVAQDELCSILKHELVHYKRNDLLYKHLALAATAIHWFNPVVRLMGKAVNALCEISCDSEVVRSMDMDKRQSYSETIIGVVKYQSKLKTALSTNFYGGKQNMKNRISSIMDMKKKKAGALIVCLALVLTMGTGLVFAANANPMKAYISEFSAGMSAYMIPETAQQRAERKANHFEIYREFGLIYDPETDSLYFNGELVRYFEDLTPLPGTEDLAWFGLVHFTESGMVDVYAVRDFSNVTQQPSELIDHSGVLVGLRQASQEEFDARDIDRFLNPSNRVIFMPGEFEEVDIGKHQVFGIDTSIRRRGITAAEWPLEAIHTGDRKAIAEAEWSEASAIIFRSNAAPIPSGKTIAEHLAGHEYVGITLGGDIGNGGGNIYYQGQLVQVLIDHTGEHFMTIASADRGGSINIRVLRDEEGNIIGMEVVDGVIVDMEVEVND